MQRGRQLRGSVFCSRKKGVHQITQDDTTRWSTSLVRGKHGTHGPDVVVQDEHQKTPVKPVAGHVTASFGAFVAGARLCDLSETVVRRSKRMMLDSLGAGLLGSTTEIARTAVKHTGLLGGGGDSQGRLPCALWGRSPGGQRSSLIGAAFANGVMTHAMDYDDVWNPATRPTSSVLPAVLALAEAAPGQTPVSAADLLLAFNIGIEVQGLLLRFTRDAEQIPTRFHPPAVFGVMGSAAACAKLLGLDAQRCCHALAIAAAFAGAPIANAGTGAKPLHAGNSARFGLEAAFLADSGVRGSEQILDNQSGFGAYFTDYHPRPVIDVHDTQGGWALDIQDVAFKSFPAHIGMHWAADAASKVRPHLVQGDEPLSVDTICKIVVEAPSSKYVNRPLPADEHAARHSFQFNTCVTLLDGRVEPASFREDMITRPELRRLLELTTVVTPGDNQPNLDHMYIRVTVETQDGRSLTMKCTTPYGHWRLPLSDADLQKKFSANAMAGGLADQQVALCVDAIQNMENIDRPTLLEFFDQLN